MSELVWSFAPWLLFIMAVRVTNVYVAAGVAGVAAIVVLVRAASRAKAHLFDVVGVVYFVGLLTVLAIVQPGDISTWGRYAQAVAHGSLTVIVFGSVLIGHPFTESYAREKAPPEVWKTPHFHALNRKISLVWGLAFVVGTISLVLAGATDSRQVLLRVIVPFGALGYAYTVTERLTAQAKHPTQTTPSPLPSQPEATGRPEVPTGSDTTQRP
jgi:hypothetical protein